MASLIEEAAKIQATGVDSFNYLCGKYPSIPIEVVTSAWLTACETETEKWWQSIEKTIDGEVIKNALARA